MIPCAFWMPAANLLAATLFFAAGARTAPVTYPQIGAERIAVEELRVTETSYAALRRPPGEGPLPAVIFMHGGLGQSSMQALRTGAVESPAQARFLAAGYVAVNATRREIRTDPGDRGVVDDTLALIQAVQALPYVDSSSVALYGGSGGGTLALEAASVSDELAAVVAGEPATIIYMGMFTREHVDFGADGKVTGDRRREVMSVDPDELYTPELARHTRAKLDGLSTPVLILHGDQHPLEKFNIALFVPEMVAMGKPVTVMRYPGEYHGFYWGRGRIPTLARQSNIDAEAWLREQMLTKPRPVDESWIEQVEVVPLGQADPN